MLLANKVKELSDMCDEHNKMKIIENTKKFYEEVVQNDIMESAKLGKYHECIILDQYDIESINYGLLIHLLQEDGFSVSPSSGRYVSSTLYISWRNVNDNTSNNLLYKIKTFFTNVKDRSME